MLTLMAKPVATQSWTNEQIIGAATGRLAEAMGDLKPAEPYHVAKPDGDTIVIQPVTRRRRKGMKAAQASYLLTAAKLNEVLADKTATQETIKRINDLVDAAEEAYDRALFGDAYDALVEYFEDQQEENWDALYNDVHAALVSRISLPEDVCSKCGKKLVEDEEEGKGEPSSTSATDTGQS